MAQSKATTVNAYLAEMPDAQREAISTVRALVLARLPEGYEEGMQHGMIHYYVPLTRFPETYNGHPLCYAGLAAQKNYCTIHLMGIYADAPSEKKLKAAFEKAGKTLNMGKACVRFNSAADLALDAIGDSIASMPVDDYVALYERSRLKTKAGQKAAATRR
ncbi:MAG: hypothetical protein JWM95_705 [Gemmatimonadetes bacterium]|nr:hypothetical protein [Gemmatimonadota bacterium]